MDLRIKRLNRFSLKLADIKVTHHPQRKKVDVIFNDVVTDIYGDSTHDEEFRCEKWAIVRKTPDMAYVQSVFYEDLLEDVDSIPWVVILTVSKLPRQPKQDDHIIIKDDDGSKIYTISKVKPINRDVPVIFQLLIYPERSIDDKKL